MATRNKAPQSTGRPSSHKLEEDALMCLKRNRTFVFVLGEVTDLGKGVALGPQDYYNDNGLEDADFFRLFEAYDVNIEQANWNDIQMVSYHDSIPGRRACLSIRASHDPVEESQVLSSSLH